MNSQSAIENLLFLCGINLSLFHISLIKSDLVIRSQTTNDTDGENCKLRRRKLSFQSEIEKGN